MNDMLEAHRQKQMDGLRDQLASAVEGREVYARLCIALVHSFKTGEELAVVDDNPAFPLDYLHQIPQTFSIHTELRSLTEETEEGEDDGESTNMVVVIVDPKGEDGSNGMLAVPDRRIITP